MYIPTVAIERTRVSIVLQTQRPSLPIPFDFAAFVARRNNKSFSAFKITGRLCVVSADEKLRERNDFAHKEKKESNNQIRNNQL